MAARRPKSQVQRARAFGERIRSLRRQQKLRQRDVAEQVPISAGHLSRLETGDYGPPSDEVIERLAVVLTADPEELLRLAGRDVSQQRFEDQVLQELRLIRSGIDRLETALAGSCQASKS